MPIGNQIRKARKYRGLTQVETAAKANMSRPYLGDIERSRYNPSVDTLIELSKVLNVEMPFFFSEDDAEDILPISNADSTDTLITLFKKLPTTKQKQVLDEIMATLNSEE